MHEKKVAVIGAGNGGQAMAGHLAMLGAKVTLYNRTPERLAAIKSRGGITLRGQLDGFGLLEATTSDMGEAVKGASLIMVVTTADGHRDVAKECATHLDDEQIIVLNPGRTCGALEFRSVLQAQGAAPVKVAEAQSLVYACRVSEPGVVSITGIKRHVPIAALPSPDMPAVMAAVGQFYDCFTPAPSVLQTSLENIGAIFHPALVLFNATRIERGERFRFYEDATPKVCAFLERLDAERLAIGRAYGFELTSASDWIRVAYGNIPGGTMYSRMRQNPAYGEIEAPTRLESRLLREDVPTGLVPMIALAQLAQVDVPLMQSVVHLASALLQEDLSKRGRDVDSLGLAGMTTADVIGVLT